MNDCKTFTAQLIHTALLGLILTSSIPAMAHHADVVASGLVLTEQSSPLEGAQVIVLSQRDSTFVKSTITDPAGHFDLGAIPAKSFLRFSYIGYETIDRSPAPDMRVVMKEDATLLSGISVTASRLTNRSTGYTYDLSRDPSAKGRKMTDILTMLPNVSYQENALSILGRPLSVIYIDDVVSDLREVEALRADQIERVDIDYTSVSKESADNPGPVLKIKLKPSAHNGLLGLVSAEGSAAPHYGLTGGNLYNSLTAKVSSLSLRNSLYLSRQLLYSDYHNSQWIGSDHTGSPTSEYDTRFRSPETYIYDRLNLSGKVSDRSLLSLSGYYALEAQKPTTYTTEASKETETHAKSSKHTAQAVLGYTYTGEAQTIGITTDYLYSDLEQLSGDLIYEGRSRQRYHMLRLRPEYRLSLADGGATLTLGGDYRLIRMRETTNGSLPPTAMRSHTPALYASYQGQSGMMMYSAGLRYQYNWLETTRESKSSSHHFGSLYPSLALSYMIDPERGHMVMLQTERGTEEIPYSAISDYRVYETSKLYTTGNPLLRTPINWQTVAMIRLWGQLGISAMYIHYRDPIVFRTMTDPADPETLFTQPVNGKYQSLLGLGVEWTKQILPEWQAKLSASYSLHGADAGFTSVKNQQKCNFQLSNSFNFSPTMGGGLNAMYEPTSHYLDRTFEQVYYVNGYFFKTFLKGALELRADALLSANGRVLTTSTPDLRLREANVTKKPYLTLSVTYNFGRGEEPQTTPFTESIQSYQTVEDHK